MRLLVTGGCGFIGSNFLHHWSSAYPSDQLVNLDLLTYAGNPDNVADLVGRPTYRFVRGDIGDANAARASMKGCDYVVHFAAETHVDRSIKDPMAFVATNVVGTGVLLEEARRADIKRFHHVSTDEVFGMLPLEGDEKFSESSPYRPSSPYAASKAAADHLVRAYAHTYGLKVTITNGSNNFGPFQHREKMIPRFITSLANGGRMGIYGSGQNVRDWLHVSDYCRAIELVLTLGRAGGTYCVGGDKPLDNMTVARRIANAFGRSEEAIEHIADRPGHDLKYAIDSTKIRNELGWRPRRTFDRALAQTIEWYRAHESWSPPALVST